MRLSLVAAVAANGVIGAEGSIPWHHPEDLAHFKRTTVGHPVIMGRRTFEDIRATLGGPLPDRHNVVLTSQPGRVDEPAVAVDSVEAAIEAAAATGAATSYVIGGGTVYEQFLQKADELVLTELHEAHDGDTTFPSVDWDDWREAERDQYEAFDIVRYTRP